MPNTPTRPELPDLPIHPFIPNRTMYAQDIIDWAVAYANVAADEREAWARADARRKALEEAADMIAKSADETKSLAGFATRRNVASEVRALIDKEPTE